jgi:hypothetical protein
MSDPIRKRGGKSRRIFKITAEGSNAITAFEKEIETGERAEVQ